jgi:hypothetical protein
MVFAITHQQNKEMPLKSISELWELTGYERKLIKKKLQGLPFSNGQKGGHLYESTEALPIIYSVDSLEVARAKHALSQASLNAVREEDLRKERIPIQDVRDAIDEVFQAQSSTLKAAKNKKLTPDLINELLDKFRSLPKWEQGT